MLNVAEIKKAFTGLIGFSDDMSAHTQALSSSLKQSTSGVYFQDAHPLVTLQVLEEIAPRDLKLLRFPEVEDIDYTKGTVVRNGTELYEALADTTYNSATTRFDADWEETTLFSIWLKSKVQASISKVVQTVLATSAINLDARNTLAEASLFTGAGYIKDIIPNNSNLVGLIIEQKAIKGVSLKINRIGFQSTKIGELPIYIFHSSSALPVKVITLTKNTANSFEWCVQDNLVLSNYNYDTNGYWIIVYNQDDLQSLNSSAIRTAINLNQACTTCRQASILGRFMDVVAFTVDNSTFNGKLWDQNNNIYQVDTNFGFNLDIAVVCDFTEIFTSHKNDFINLIKLQFAADMLHEYIYNANARVNRTAAITSRADVLFALDGDSSKFSRRSGLAYDLERAYKAFIINTKGFNTRCLPCDRRGIKYKSIL